VKLRATVIVWAVVAVILAGCGATVPDVVGMSLSQAYDTLEAAGFEVDTPAYHEDSTVAPGTVIAQDPEGGSRADEGLAVSLVVAGPPPVETPDLEGLDLVPETDTLTGATAGALSGTDEAVIFGGAAAVSAATARASASLCGRCGHEVSSVTSR
jgi:beta-lactam-binding protein with PASTA domain